MNTYLFNVKNGNDRPTYSGMRTLNLLTYQLSVIVQINLHNMLRIIRYIQYSYLTRYVI